MAILAIGYSHATTEAIDFSQQKYENQQVVTTLKGKNCTITFRDGSNPCAYYNTGNAVRIYGGGSVQITSNLAITKVVYTFSGTSYAPTSSDCTITPSTGKATLGTTSLTWTGNTQSLKITRTSGKGHWRLQKIEITYTDDAVATPTFTPAGGQFTDVLDVTIACATTGAAIKYSTDGGTTWLDYTTPVAVTAASTTITAKAVRDGKESATATAIYTIVPATPTFTPAGRQYTDAQSVTLACATTGAAIKYSTDGGTTWLDYTTPVAVTAASTTITAKAVRDGQESTTATATYQVVPAAPTLSQGSSLFADPFTLTITRGAGATSMVYTVNGTSTTTTEATVSLPIAETTTVTAHGVNDAGTQSPEVSATYTYSTLAGTKYKLVTSASELVAGKHYVIVCRLSDPNYAMSGSGHDPSFANGSDYNRSYSQGFSYVDASTRDEIVVTDLSTVLTLAGSEGKWQWRVSNATDKDGNPIEGYLQVETNPSSHWLRVYNTDNNSYNEANTLTTVTFPEGGIKQFNSTKTEPAGVQITFNVSPKDDKGRDKFIMMNPGNSHYFGPYGTQYPVCLYGEVSSEPATITLKDLMTQGSGAFDVADASMQAITRVKDKVASRYYVLVKDADGASIEKVEKAEGLASYKVNGQDQTVYDQSNWMLVEVSEQDYAAFYKENCSVSRIAGGLYNGDACNPVLSRAADGTMPVITYGDKGDQYTPNQYCPVNFMASYTSDYSGNGAQGSNGTATYFFMNPKAQEYATVVWAVWDKATGAFYVPAPDGVNNKLGFYGKFEVALDYNDGDVKDVKDLTAVQDQHMYTFPAIVKKLTAQQAAARKVNANTGGGTAQPGYIVYPLELNAASGVVTAVSDVHSTKAVKRVSYYNLAGAKIAAPQAGVNIVVTTYTDGTTRATKLLK